MKSINTYYEDFESLREFISENHDTIYEMNPSVVFVQIFSGCDDSNYLSSVSSDISRLVPHARIIGATASSVIMNGEVCGLKTVLSFSILYHSNVRCALLPKEGKSDFDLGVSLVSQLNSSTAKALIVYTASPLININELLLGIGSVNPSLPVVGGKAGDTCHYKVAALCCNGQISECGVVGAVLEGKQLTASRYWHLGWQPIGKAMTVTKAEGLRIYTIDNLPAFEVYKKYLGLDKAGQFSTAVEYPLLVIRDGIQMARVPVAHYEDDSITFGADLRAGETVWLSFGNAGMILDCIESTCTVIQQRPVESLFVCSCACRRGYLQSLSKLETEPLQAIAPTAGLFACGEFFHTGNRTHLFNATMTILALSEADGLVAVKSPRKVTTRKEIQLGEENPKDNVAAKEVGVLRALTHLINTVIAELEEAQAKLQYNVIGEMAAGIGHEVRNPMTTVRGYLQMFQRKEEFSAYNSQLSVMIEELDRANLIITEFLSLSKHKRVEMEFGNINSVLDTLFPLLQSDAFQRGHDIYLETGNIPDFEFDDKEIRQLIVNLARNGLEAMKSAGVLSISTNFSNNQVILSVQDTGSGIAQEIMDKLGTPFVTTKDEGTGIGLSVCYRIADRHRAEIEITTGDYGTTFAVKFKVTKGFE